MLQKRNKVDPFTSFVVFVFPLNRVSFSGLGP